MAHMTRNRPEEADEATRLESLAYIVFSKQVLEYQIDQGRYASFEQPPQCMSWQLEIVKGMMNYGGHLMDRTYITTDGCCWGAVDPGNGLPYKKAFGFWANVADLSSVAVHCQGRHPAHQTVHQNVATGPRAGERRTTVSGEYPEMMCSAIVAAMIVQMQPVGHFW